jgi:ABC-2 type transport system ATP-binding protein
MLRAGRVVALDTTRNLLSRFRGLTVRLAAARVPQAWRERVLRHEAGLFYLGLASYDVLERLLAALREENITIDELALAETDLEQVFLRIMSEDEALDPKRPSLELPESGATL